MKTIFVKDINEGKCAGQIESHFLLVSKETRTTKAGKAYSHLKLADKTGEIEAKLWEIAADDLQCQSGDFILVFATASEYNDKMQLKVQRIDTVPDAEIDESDFFPVAPRDLDEMLAELDTIIETAISGDLSRLTKAIVEDDAIRPLLRRCPASQKMHHAYRGGLLEHILGICRLVCGLRVANCYDIDYDLLYAAAVLHDIGKIYEYDFARTTKHTTMGALLGHIPIGLDLVSKCEEPMGARGSDCEGLLHLIASHHGTLEWGSPVVPALPEAMIFHHLDMIDSRMGGIAAVADQAGEDGFSAYVPIMRTRMVLP